MILDRARGLPRRKGARRGGREKEIGAASESGTHAHVYTYVHKLLGNFSVLSLENNSVLVISLLAKEEKERPRIGQQEMEVRRGSME